MILWHSMTRPILAYFFERFNGLQIQLTCDVWSSRKHETWLLHAGNGHSMDTDRYNWQYSIDSIWFDHFQVLKRCAGEPQSVRECQAFAAASLPEALAAKNTWQPSAWEDNKARSRFSPCSASKCWRKCRGSEWGLMTIFFSIPFYTFLSLMQLSCFKLFPDPCWVELALLRCWTNRMEALELHIVLACLGTVITIQL